MTVMGGQVRYLGAEYAQKLGQDPIGYQFPERYVPWGHSEMGMFGMF